MTGGTPISGNLHMCIWATGYHMELPFHTWTQAKNCCPNPTSDVRNNLSLDWQPPNCRISISDINQIPSPHPLQWGEQKSYLSQAAMVNSVRTWTSDIGRMNKSFRSLTSYNMYPGNSWRNPWSKSFQNEITSDIQGKSEKSEVIGVSPVLIHF